MMYLLYLERHIAKKKKTKQKTTQVLKYQICAHTQVQEKELICCEMIILMKYLHVYR